MLKGVASSSLLLYSHPGISTYGGEAERQDMKDCFINSFLTVTVKLSDI